MEQQKSAFNFINKICAFFLVIWICWPWFSQNTGLIAGLVFSAGWCVTAVCMSRKYAVGIDGAMMMAYVALMAMSFLSTGRVHEDYELYYHVSMTALFFLPYYMCKFYIDREEKKFLGQLAIVAIIFMILGCYTSIRYTMIDENIMKTISQGLDEEFIEYRKSGIGSFGFIYMVMFAFIGMIGLFKNGKLNVPLWVKILLIITCGIGFSCLVASTFTTSLVLVTVGTVLVLITQRKSKTANVIIYISVFIAAFFTSQLVGNILISTSFESSDVNTRMHEIGNLLLGNEAGENILSRAKYFNRSIKCFLQYPILGYNFEFAPTIKSGAHSEWIDIFAVYGIVGGIPLLTTIIIKLKNTAKILKEKINYPFYSVIVFVFVIFGFVDPFLRLYNIGFVMFMFIPCIACIPYAFEKIHGERERLNYKLI